MALWNEFVTSEDAAAQSRIGMLKNAREVVTREERDECPLCGQPVDVDALRQRILAALDGLSEASQRLDDAREDIEGLLGRVERVTYRLEQLRVRGTDLEVEVDQLPPSPVARLHEHVDGLDTVAPDVLADHAREVDFWLDSAAETVDQAAPKLAEGRETTFSELTRLAVLARQWHEQRQEVSAAGHARDLAERIYDAYAAAQQRHLDEVLDNISKRVADIYASLHPEEGLNAVSLNSLGEKAVELTVTFHGEEHRPPQRVLSESRTPDTR
jgi:hypothetical protein